MAQCESELCRVPEADRKNTIVELTAVALEFCRHDQNRFATAIEQLGSLAAVLAGTIVAISSVFVTAERPGSRLGLNSPALTPVSSGKLAAGSTLFSLRLANSANSL